MLSPTLSISQRGGGCASRAHSWPLRPVLCDSVRLGDPEVILPSLACASGGEAPH